MSVRVKDVEQYLEQMAPKKLAESWDKVGLFFGKKENQVKKIQVSLGISLEVVQEAISNHVDMIVTHHPIWLKPPVFFTEDDPEGKLIADLIRHRISVLSAHTNLDSCADGINDVLAQLFELEQVEPLQATVEEWFKLVTFVPLTHVEMVKEALGESGAGQIGNYSHCSFSVEGRGSFLPLEGSNPAIGGIGEKEEVSEARLEVILNSNILQNVINQLKYAHPYEEVAYDLYPLKNKIPSSIGMGRVGVLKEKMKLGNFVALAKEKLMLPGLRYCGNPEQKIQKVALCGGSGMSLFSKVKEIKADVFLTGDIKHHEAEEALKNDIALVDAGHYGTEKNILPILVNYLKKIGEIEVYQSQSEEEIFKFE